MKFDARDRQAEEVGGDLGEDRPRAGAEIVSGAGDKRPAIGEEANARGGGPEVAGIGGGGHSPAEKAALIVTHGARCRISF